MKKKSESNTSKYTWKYIKWWQSCTKKVQKAKDCTEEFSNMCVKMGKMRKTVLDAIYWISVRRQRHFFSVLFSCLQLFSFNLWHCKLISVIDYVSASILNNQLQHWLIKDSLPSTQDKTFSIIYLRRKNEEGKIHGS